MQGHAHARVVELLIAEFERDEREEFSFARSIPSSVIGRHLTVYNGLSLEERRRIKRAQAKNRSACFGFPKDLAAQVAARAFTLSAFQVAPGQPHQSSPTPTAAELRKLATLSMAQLLNATPRATGEPGEREYAGLIENEQIAVRTRHGIPLIQVEYSVHFERLPAITGDRYSGWSYESLVGFGVGWWDGITTANADQSFATLKESVLRTVRTCSSILAIIE